MLGSAGKQRAGGKWVFFDSWLVIGWLRDWCRLLHEFDGYWNEQEKKDASHPHNDLPVNIRLAMTPEIIDPGGTDDGHRGTNGQHEGDEGIQHVSNVKGKTDENTGDQKK